MRNSDQLYYPSVNILSSSLTFIVQLAMTIDYISVTFSFQLRSQEQRNCREELFLSHGLFTIGGCGSSSLQGLIMFTLLDFLSMQANETEFFLEYRVGRP